MTGGWSPSAAKCIQRTRREHEDLVSEFESILKGMEQTLNSTGMSVQRLTDEEMFLELKRAMNPLFRDDIAYRRPELTIDYRSAREQAANTHIEDDQETYIKIGGLLYSFLSLKDLPDATYPGSFASCWRSTSRWWSTPKPAFPIRRTGSSSSKDGCGA